MGSYDCGKHSRKASATQTYRLELTLLEDPGEDEASQRHRHDEDEGERQGGRSGLHYPQSHDACQLGDGKHVHAPCLHLKKHTRIGQRVRNQEITAQTDISRDAQITFLAPSSGKFFI